MFFGVYICAAGLFLALSLLLFPAVGRRQRRFILLALSLPLVGLVSFIALSAWLGLLQFGAPQSYSYPADYLGRGLPGWVAMLLPILGALSPLSLAYWLNHRIQREGYA